MSRKGLREVVVECPEWSDTPTILREPRVRDFLESSSASSDQERTIILLAAMVLGDDGKPVGKEAILDAPMAAISALASHIPGLINVEKNDRPLTQSSPSDIA